MKYYNNFCEGCGVKKQNDDFNKLGYVTNINFTFCQNCFKSKNYGKTKTYSPIFLDKNEFKKLKDNLVFMVIDILNPFETIINDINNYVDKNNLVILINKRDLLQKVISENKIKEWIIKILNIKKIFFSKLIIVSSIKKINIDEIMKIIENSKNKCCSFIGFSNVGKTSILNSLFNSKGLKINNLILNSIGTTKEIIDLKYKNKIISDYPGIFLNGNYQNLLSEKELKIINPKKEIKVKNYQLFQNRMICIGNYAKFNIVKSLKKSSYQFTFSNFIDIKNCKINNVKINLNKEYNKYEINLLKVNNKYDLIISGLGIITFKFIDQNLELFLPKKVNYNIVESLYN